MSYRQGSAKRFLGGIEENHPPPKGGVCFPSNPEPPVEDKRVAEASPERKAAALWLQENMPTVASVAAGFREAFGDVRLVWAREGGHEVGQAS